MATSVLVNRAGMSSATVGTGTITLGTALGSVAPYVCSFKDFAAAGLTDGQTVSYLILDSNGAWEVGSGVYTASGTTLTRTVTKSSNANAAISLTGDEQVYVTARAEDLLAGPGTYTDKAAVRASGTAGQVQNSALLVADTTGAVSRSGGGGIPVQGTNTNDAAAAGNVGELFTCAAPGTTSTVTITNASPGIISWTAHGLSQGSAVFLTTSGGLPTGLVVNTVYFVTYGSTFLANSFALSTTVANAVAGTAINTSSAGSGTHTAHSGFIVASATTIDFGGVSLTAGDWDVAGVGVVSFDGSASFTRWQFWLSTASATLPNLGDITTPSFRHIQLTAAPAAQDEACPIPVGRISIASTTTLFLSVRLTYTVSATVNGYGYLIARRAR